MSLGEILLKKLKEMHIKYAFIFHLDCLMDNHGHFFIKKSKPNLSQDLHYHNSFYAIWFRNKHQILGPLF